MRFASEAITLCFILLSFAAAGTLVLGTWLSGLSLGESDVLNRRKTGVLAIALAVYLSACSSAAGRGLLPESSLPGVLIVSLPAALVAVGAAFSGFGERIARGLDMRLLVGAHGLRVGVALVVWRLYIEGLLPAEMTVAGLDFDVVVGLGALPLAVLASQDRLRSRLLLTWNSIGLVLLCWGAGVALACTPGPLNMFEGGVANEIVRQSPFVWLPAFLMPLALFGHLVVFRRAWLERSLRSPPLG